MKRRKAKKNGSKPIPQKIQLATAILELVTAILIIANTLILISR